MKPVVFDIETDGLLHELTRVHCLVLKDLDTGERLSCTDDSPTYPSIQEGLEVLSQADRLYGHNVIGFDIPALQQVYPEWTYKGNVLDTLVAVRLRWAHIKEQDFARARRGTLPGGLIGWQSLEAWGYRLGIFKGDYGKTEDWGFWSPEMQRYCEQDVAVTEALIEKIRSTGGIPKEALEVEHELSWYLNQQERNGWPFDFEAAVRLQATLAQRRQELEEELKDQFGCWVEPKTKDGETVEFTPKRSNSRYGYIEGCPMSRVEIKEFNPGSRLHIADRLQKVYGWEPEEFTPTGRPKVSDDILLSLEIEGTESIRDYLTVDKRLGQLSEGKKAWLKMMEQEYPEGGSITGLPHIHHSCTSTTITHRHRHSNPNLGQVPSIESEYGEECRALFTVPEGWVLVGSDASSLEARCLAHYMAAWDEGEYGRIILEEDVHSKNAEAIGHGIGRYGSKTFFYAYIYGAGDEKLGSIVKPEASSGAQKKIGKTLRTNFEAGIPAMGSLVSAVRGKARQRNFLNLVDGRRAYVRSEYAALNTLLQGTGAVLTKFWIVEYNRRLAEKYETPSAGGWLYPWAALGYIHDEVQVAVDTNRADPEEVGEILVDSLRSLTEKFDLRVPLDGEYKIGPNWSSTH